MIPGDQVLGLPAGIFKRVEMPTTNQCSLGRLADLEAWRAYQKFVSNSQKRKVLFSIPSSTMNRHLVDGICP